MATRIVMVFDKSDFDMATLIDDEVVRAFKKDDEPVELEWAPSRERAIHALETECALLITPLHIRETNLCPLKLDEERGIDLVNWVENNTRIPSILVTPSYTPRLEDARTAWRQCYLVTTSSDMVQKIAERAKSVVRDRPAKCLDIEIQLRDKTLWGYKLNGRGFSFTSPDRTFAIDGNTVDEMVEMSDSLGFITSGPIFFQTLHRLGSKLLAALSKDPNFSWDVSEGLTQAGGETNARLTFAVSPELHGLALETVVCPRSREKHWMLEAPVCRRLLSDQTVTEVLFSGSRKLSCLVIEADASGSVGALNMNLDKLASVADESKWLEDRLTAFDMQVEVVRNNNSAVSFVQRLQELLRRRRWDIIHFTGHSYYDLDSEKGFVFLPGASAGSIEKIDIVQFSGWIRQSSLFYFSSCDSGAGPFMFELANRGIPNLVGFRWSIEDRLAFEYTREFYQNLFDVQSLKKASVEKAFLKSRQTMHDRYPQNVFWAAPLLIKQSPES